MSCRRCDVGQDSLHAILNANGAVNSSGSAGCTLCAHGYYRRDVHDPATACEECGSLPGVRCSANATLKTLELESGYWRHSEATIQTVRCREDDGWTPCSGGIDAGDDGDGYCAAGYHGPRCELCVGTTDYSRYFDQLDARCHECGDVTAQSSIFFSALLLLFLAALFGGSAIMRRRGPLRNAMVRKLTKFQKIWRRAGLRYKVKLAVGLYQCIAAISSVFDVNTPQGLHEYAKLLRLLEFPADLGIDVIIPASCFGSYESRLILGSCWPIMFALVVTASLVGWEIRRPLRRHGLAAPRDRIGAVRRGLRHALPANLWITFLLVPSTAARIFKTFLCEPIEYDYVTGEVRRYLHDDLNMSCDSPGYAATRNIALVFLVVWPLGTPLLYASLLHATRDALSSGKPTPLSRATVMLWADYTASSCWWEPLEMCRKLALTGEGLAAC